MIYPRWLARLLAFLGRYSWRPCPVCGQPFAGYESGSYALFEGNVWEGRSVCNRGTCQVQARYRTGAYFATAQARAELSRAYSDEAYPIGTYAPLSQREVTSTAAHPTVYVYPDAKETHR